MGSQDVGVLITAPGTDVSNAPTNQVIMDTSKPFIKIDTQKSTSFQTLLFIINTDPPEPVGPATDTYTKIYQFKHGYSYTPSIETLFYVSAAPPGATFSQTYFQDKGVLGAHTIADSATLYAEADITWVYFIIDKFKTTGGSSNLLTGTNVQATVHIFVEDIGEQLR